MNDLLLTLTSQANYFLKFSTIADFPSWKGKLFGNIIYEVLTAFLICLAIYTRITLNLKLLELVGRVKSFELTRNMILELRKSNQGKGKQ